MNCWVTVSPSDKKTMVGQSMSGKFTMNIYDNDSQIPANCISTFTFKGL